MDQLFSQGIQITISWIPSHVGIRGNERVDVLAKDGLLLQHVNFPIAPDISDLNIMIKELVMHEWQVKWNTSTKGRFFHGLEPNVSEAVKYSDPCRPKQTAITRLRFNKSLLGETQFKFKKKDNPLCDVCSVKEDVSHFLLDCSDHVDLQVTRNDELILMGITPTLKSILGNKNAYGPLWHYIADSHKIL